MTHAMRGYEIGGWADTRKRLRNNKMAVVDSPSACSRSGVHSPHSASDRMVRQPCGISPVTGHDSTIEIHQALP
jgi:hypothetical protein